MSFLNHRLPTGISVFLQAFQTTRQMRSQAQFLGHSPYLYGTFFLLNRSLVYCQRLWLRNSQMEEIHGERLGERVCSLHALSRCASLPTSPHVHQPGISPKKGPTFCLLWIFVEASLQSQNWLRLWSLVIDSTSISSTFPVMCVWECEIGQKIQFSNHMVDSIGTSSHP